MQLAQSWLDGTLMGRDDLLAFISAFTKPHGLNLQDLTVLLQLNLLQLVA